jgi:two-component system sensor histidine kinase BaeS
MRLSIAQKLVAAFVGLTLLVLIATLGLARWSFEQGFLDYVNALEKTRLERVQADLADEYMSAGHSWRSLSEQRFAVLMRRSVPREPLGRPPPRGIPPPSAGTGDMHPPPARRPGSLRTGAQGAPPTEIGRASCRERV